MNIQNLLLFLMELIGTIAFAASGVMVGIRKNMDLFGVCVLGTVTAVGGGTIRDIVLCQIPSALLEPIYVETSVITALLIFGFLYFKADKNAARFHNSYDRVMQLMDAIGLGYFHCSWSHDRNQTGLYRQYIFARIPRHGYRCGRWFAQGYDGRESTLYFCKAYLCMRFGDGGNELYFLV